MTMVGDIAEVRSVTIVGDDMFEIPEVRSVAIVGEMVRDMLDIAEVRSVVGEVGDMDATLGKVEMVELRSWGIGGNERPEGTP